MLIRHRQYLADNLWLTSHEERDGRLRTSSLAVGLGLSGALLGELLLAGRIGCTPDGRLQLTEHSRTATGDNPLADFVLRDIVKEMSKERHDRVDHVSDWLTSLSTRAEGWVARRLRDQDVVEQVEIRKLFRTETRYTVIHLGDGDAPTSNLRGRLERRDPLQERHIAFAGFAIAMNLDSVVLRDTSQNAKRYLSDLMRRTRQPLRSLIAETDAAINSTVLTHRG